MKRLFSVLMILLLLPGIFSAALNGSGAGLNAEAASGVSKSGILSIPDPTQDELRAAYALCQKPDHRFAVAPAVTAPYATGELEEEFVLQVTNRINLYRLAAKLQPLSVDEVKSGLAQHAAVLVAATKSVSHYPPKPADMEDAFYNTGALGAYVSNISSYDFHELAASNGWEWVNNYKEREQMPFALMYMIRDYEKTNFRDLGHRRYLLSPYLQSFGVGCADSADGYNYYFTIATAAKRWPADELVQDPDFEFVAWPPSGNCPSELMGNVKTFPWSITLNESRYLVPAVKDSEGQDTKVGDRSGVVLQVTRLADGRVWTFDENSPDGSQITNPTSCSEPYFCIDKQAYGFGPVVYTPAPGGGYYGAFVSSVYVFRPDFEDNLPFTGTYRVRLTGVRRSDGSDAEICYEVNFFDITPCEHQWSDWTLTAAPICTEDGEEQRVCAKCGEVETRVLEATGHSWSAWSETQAPGCTEDGARTRGCSRCGEVETETIPALGHDWDEGTVVKEPSCTEDGQRARSCRRCQLSDSVPLPALGHDWDEGVVVREPTHFEEGERLYTCLRCRQTRTEPIELLSFLFDDVKDPGKYYYRAVYWAYDHKPQITGGTDPTHFSPNANCKREQVVSFLYAAHNKPSYDTGAENPFTDVKPGKYYYPAVMWARENRITGGVSETLFGVGKYCTREQVVTFLWTAAGKPEPIAAESPFSDVKPGKYYFKAVLWAVEKGVTGGVGDGKFGVGRTCTRAQIVTFLYKATQQ